MTLKLYRLQINYSRDNSLLWRIAMAKLEGLDLTAYRFHFKSIHEDTFWQWSPAYSTHEEAQKVSDREVNGWSSKVEPVEQFVNPGDAPNYLHDLDAVNKVEWLVIRSFHSEHLYVGLLGQIAGPRNTVRSYPMAATCASAAERVEAILRLKGLWTGDDSP